MEVYMAKTAKTKQKNPYMEALAAIDRGDMEYWCQLDEDDKKKVSPFILVQWLSAYCDSEVNWDEAKRQGRSKGDGKGAWPQRTTDNKVTEDYLILVNEIINLSFWSIVSKPDIAWRLMTYISRTINSSSFKPGRNSQHVWINSGKLSKTPKLDELLQKMYPLANSDEIDIVRNTMSPYDVKEICEDFAMDAERTKTYMKEIRDYIKALEETEDE